MHSQYLLPKHCVLYRGVSCLECPLREGPLYRSVHSVFRRSECLCLVASLNPRELGQARACRMGDWPSAMGLRRLITQLLVVISNKQSLYIPLSYPTITRRNNKVKIADNTTITSNPGARVRGSTRDLSLTLEDRHLHFWHTISLYFQKGYYPGTQLQNCWEYTYTAVRKVTFENFIILVSRITLFTPDSDSTQFKIFKNTRYRNSYKIKPGSTKMSVET